MMIKREGGQALEKLFFNYPPSQKEGVDSRNQLMAYRDQLYDWSYS